MIDSRDKFYFAPEKIVWQRGEMENIRALLEVRQPQSYLWNSHKTVFKNTSQKCAICLDFGDEIYGGIIIVVGATSENKTSCLLIRFGESVSEAMNPHEDTHSVHNYISKIPFGSSISVGQTGFRFVYIELLNEIDVEIQGIYAESLCRNLPEIGQFECNDELLNRIWKIGAKTVRLCLQNYLWDGIKRDRLVWMGDIHPSLLTAHYAFGKVNLIADSMDFVRNHTPLPEWMNGISSYSLWWIISQYEWYMLYSDMSYLKLQQAYLVSLIRQLDYHIGPNNSERLPGWRFLDWPSSRDEQGLHAGLHALMIWAMQVGAHLCSVLQDRDSFNQCVSMMKRLKLHKPSLGQCKQAAALMVLAGQLCPAAANQKILSSLPAQNISTFLGTYILEARIAADDIDGCLDLIRQFWGGMLSLGATTFWEHFDMCWLDNAIPIDVIPKEEKADVHASCGDFCYKGYRKSLCHAWSSGPTSWLSKHVLGIKLSTPGFQMIHLAPKLGNLEFARGFIPTPYGLIKVHHRRTKKGILTEIEKPQEIQIKSISDNIAFK